MRHLAGLLAFFCATTAIAAPPILLKPDRVFDGQAVHVGWQVLVRATRSSRPARMSRRPPMRRSSIWPADADARHDRGSWPPLPPSL
jgi:nucleoid-associated protein YgaU